MIGLDADLVRVVGGTYDFQLCNGDIKDKNSFDAAIIVSLLADARAEPSESTVAHKRRGWIGNESTPDSEIGSKIWLYEQSRVTRTNMNGIESVVRNALQWLVADGYAVAVKSVSVTLINVTTIRVEVEIERPNSKVEHRFFDLWDKTGIDLPCVPNVIKLKITQNVSNYNVFTEAGHPNTPVSVLVEIEDAIVTSFNPGLPAFFTGQGWHPESTVTLSFSGTPTLSGIHGDDGESGGNDGQVAVEMHTTLFIDDVAGGSFISGGFGSTPGGQDAAAIKTNFNTLKFIRSPNIIGGITP